MINFLSSTSKNLIKIGYAPIRTSNNNLIDENTEELCFYKQKGAVINIVIIINTYRVINFAEKYNALTRLISSKFVKGSKILSLGIAAGDENAAAFTSIEPFTPDADIMKIHWAVDIKNKNMIFQKEAPTELDGIEKILRSYDNPSSVGSSNDQNIPPVSIQPIISYGLIIINFIIFIIMTLDGGSTNTATLIKYGALSGSEVLKGEWYRLFSCMFIHIGIIHLLSNMLWLYILGRKCEKYYGHIKFIMAYIISGVCGSLASLLFSGEVVSAGASGAIMGLTGSAIVYTAMNNTLMEGLDFYTFVLISVINIGFGFVYAGIDNFGHIGGFIGGIIIGLIISLQNKRKVLKK